MKIYLAGCEVKDAVEIVKDRMIKHAFFSYYYMRSGKIKTPWLKEARAYIDDIIVDSGAHTFFSEMSTPGLSVSVHTKKTKTKETPDIYFQKYRKWLKENYSNFDWFVELDIGELVGQEQVRQWRKKLDEDGLMEKCITVYHPEVVTYEEFIQMLEESKSKYVALEGDRPLRNRLNYLPLLKECYNRGIRVHGFAMTKDDVMRNLPFYSVDSTSWKAFAQYGSARVDTVRGSKVRRYRDREQAIQMKDFSMDFYSKDKKVSRKALYIATVNSYRNLEKFYTDLWEARGIKWDI